MLYKESDEGRSGHDEILGLNLARHGANDEHHYEGDETARRKHKARPGGRVTELLLHDLRQELGGGVEDGPRRGHHQEAGAELARRHHADVDRRIFPRHFPRNHQDEGERAHDRGPDDEARAEPVLIEPAIEHDLERAQEGGDQNKPGEVEPTPPRQFAIRDRLLGLPQDHGD